MKGRGALAKILAAAEALIFPEGVTCLCCTRGLDEDAREGICPACLRALHDLARAQGACGAGQAAPGIERVLAAYPYEAQARRLILAMKFGGIREAAAPLSRAMSALDLPPADMLVPVPTSERRIRERGYNQAALLAEGVGRARGLPVVQALWRASEREKQSLLGAAARRRNLVGSMRADGRASGARVLLVDDIYTTGSTAAEAARALREAGAVSVTALCAARSRMGAGGALPEFDRLRAMRHRRGGQGGKK